MVRFLSEEWVAALSDALNTSDAASDDLHDVELTLQQHVGGGPGGNVGVWTVFHRGRVDVGIGETQAPDVILTMDYETALALSRAEINHQAAFMQGKLTVTGNMGKLLQNQAALRSLGPAMASLETEY